MSKIKSHHFFFGIFICFVSVLLLLFWTKPSRSLFTEQKPSTISFGRDGALIDLISPTDKEMPELNALKNMSNDAIMKVALEGNRCAAYIASERSYRAAVIASNRALSAALKKDNESETLKKEADCIRGFGFELLQIAVSLGFSSAYYLTSALYAESIDQNFSDECLDMVYYLCWAKMNNFSHITTQIKERIISAYGEKLWERIENVASAKLAKSHNNQEEFSQALDKKAFIRKLLASNKNILNEDTLFTNTFWTNIK